MAKKNDRVRSAVGEFEVGNSVKMDRELLLEIEKGLVSGAADLGEVEAALDRLVESDRVAVGLWATIITLLVVAGKVGGGFRWLPWHVVAAGVVGAGVAAEPVFRLGRARVRWLRATEFGGLK